jgi:putative FmdB family regulatory protein
MPLFEYRCSDCGKKSEELVLAGDSAVAPTCLECGSSGMTRLLSTFAAHGTAKGGDEFGDLPCGDGAGEGGCENADDCGMAGSCGMGGMGGMGGGFGGPGF